ncbi:hypothetical protein NP493_1575g00020 [Ridgeia piscesae]|uniref:Small ribosomal subunit protein mS39 n=1 Tax=Ridgeia piscesae TaxID=27915 RepID=A0AAD9JYG9_RIDPI|nr:hypothetical protein NP493_1575g00020 [Ridgeia piscesae]
MAIPLTKCCCCSLVQNQRNLIRRGLWRTSAVFQEAVGTQSSSGSSQTSHQPPQGSREDGVEKIVIPKKKKRDELSILKALASTVKRDYNAPHYKYIDDPFLIPTSALEKRSYSLAKASGKKAARYVLQRYPGNFQHNPAEPSIEAFMPKSGPQLPEGEVAGLRERIERRLPTEAYLSYLSMKEKGTEVPEETMKDLLDLLCVYNSEDPEPDQFPDELYFNREVGQDNTRKIRKTWQDKGPAEQLFTEMETKDATVYGSLIKGRAKYFQVDRAYELLREMKEKGLQADVHVYNAILSIAAFLKDRPDLRWQLGQEIMADMAASGVQPNLQTFNNVLYLLSRGLRFKETPNWMMQVINEMKRCFIEPSLATWYYLIQGCYTTDGKTCNICSFSFQY